MSDYQQQEMEHERFRIIEGLLREIVANTAPAQPRPKLPKVREALSLLIWKIDNGEQNRSIGHYAGMLTHALSELDAVEGRGES